MFKCHPAIPKNWHANILNINFKILSRISMHVSQIITLSWIRKRLASSDLATEDVLVQPSTHPLALIRVYISVHINLCFVLHWFCDEQKKCLQKKEYEK